MEKQAYLKKFSRIIRWRLSKSDADEVLADYEELLSQYCEEEHLSIQRMGEPVQAAKLLSDPPAYHRWLTAFAVMACCLLFFETFLLQANFSHPPSGLLYIFFILGAAVSLIWFRPRRGKDRKFPFPKALLPLLLCLLMVAAAAGVLLTGLVIRAWEFIPPALYGRIAYGTLLLGGTSSVGFGLLGLIKARVSDRRWCSLYIMGLTGAAECVLVLALLTSPTLGLSSTAWLMQYACQLGAVGIAGLTGAVVSLC